MRRRHHRRYACLIAALAALGAMWTGTAAAATETLASGLGTSWGMTLDADGNVYTVDLATDTVAKILPNGAKVTDASWPALVGDQPVAIAIGADGYLYTANAGGASVSRIAPDGTVDDWASLPGSDPRALAIAPDGSIYVASYTNQKVYKVEPDGTVAGGNWPASVSNSFDAGICSIAIGPDGSVYAGHANTGDLWKIAPDGTVADGNWPVHLTEPRSIAVGPDGAIYAANFHDGVSKVLPDGNEVVTGGWPALNGRGAAGIAIDTAGNVYTNADFDQLARRIARLSTGGSLTDISTTPGYYAKAMAIGSDGAVYAVNGSDGSVTKTTQTGAHFPAPDVPAAPAATAGVESAAVTITPNPTDYRFGAPTTYTVTAVQDATKHCAITAPATSCTVTGLTGGRSYTFTATATLQLWTTTASTASAAIAPKARPGKPSVVWSRSKPKKTATALITPVAGTAYVLTAVKSGKTKTAACKAVTVKGKARWRCTITLAKGTWHLAVTPTRNGATGTPATKTYTFS